MRRGIEGQGYHGCGPASLKQRLTPPVLSKARLGTVSCAVTESCPHKDELKVLRANAGAALRGPLPEA